MWKLNNINANTFLHPQKSIDIVEACFDRSGISLIFFKLVKNYQTMSTDGAD